MKLVINNLGSQILYKSLDRPKNGVTGMGTELPCMITYGGSEPLNQQETIAWDNWFKEIRAHGGGAFELGCSADHNLTRTPLIVKNSNFSENPL